MTTMNPYKLLRSSWLASLLGLTALGLVAGPAHAATLTWGTSGTGGEGTWTATDGWWNGTTQQSWSNATPDDAIFGGTGGAVTLAGGTTTAGSITFDPFAGSYTIGTASQALTINGGGITMNSGAGTVTFQNSPITLGAAQSWTNNSSSLLTVSSGITNGGNLLTVAGSGNATLADAIAGTGGITKNGSGVLTLSATNTHTGTTTVNAGLLTSPANAGAVVRLSSFGTGPIEIGASGTVQMTGWNGQNLNSANAYYVNGYTNAVSGSGVLALEGQSGSFSVNYSGDLSGFSGTISATAAAGTYVGVGNTGSEAIRLSGSSTRFVVSGGGTLLPVITSAGTIALGELSGDGIVSARINVASTWQVGGLSTSSTFSGRLTDNGSGALALTKVGSGTLTLSGSSSYTGGTTVSAGSLVVANTAGLGAGSVTLGGGFLQFAVTGTIANPFAITATSGTFDSQSNAVTLTGAVSGAGGFIKVGSGTLTLSGSGSFTGTTRIGSGTLIVGASTALSASTLDMNADDFGSITFNQNATLGGLLGARDLDMGSHTLSIGNNDQSTTYSGVLSNGGLTKIGSGTLTLTASNVYTGNTTISGGRLALTGNGVLGSGSYAGAIANAGNLSIDNNAAQVFSGVISGIGSLTKNGSGVLTLSANNTYTGTTTVDAGLLTSPANAGAVVRLSSFGTGPIEIGASGTVQMTGWNGQNLGSFNAYYVNGYTNAVSGSGVLALEGQSGSFSVNYSGDLSGFSGTISATAAAGTYVGVGNTGSEAIRLSGSSTRFVVSGEGTLLPVITSAGTIALGELSGDGIVSARNGVASTWQVGGLSTSSTFSGRLTDNGSGALALTKVGSGTLTLSGSSSFSGGARVDAGTLAFGALTALGSGTVTLGGGALQSAVAGTLANPIAITAASGTFDSQANTNTLSGTISGAADFVKIGSGTLTLAAANTYSGDTRVSAGALRLAAAGSFADSGRIIVGDAGSSGAVLDLTAKTSFAIGADQTLMGGGTALLGASTALTVSGTFSPGNSPGLFTYDGGSTTLAGTTLLEVWGTTRATSPSHGDGFYDAVNVIDGGLLTLGGALVLDFDQNFADSASFLLFDTLTNGSLAGGFGSIMIRGLNNDYAGLSFTQAGNVWTTGFNFNNQGLRLTQTSSSVVLDVIVVPEPGAIALAGCGVALAGWIAARHSRRR